MHQPGNCRCWFVCIQGSACSRSQESFFQGLSVEPFEFCFKKFKSIFNFIPQKHLFLKEVSLCMFNFMSILSGNGPEIKFKLSPTVINNSSLLSPASLASLSLSLTVGLVLSVPAVGGRYMRVTGCAAQEETHTTWHVLRATRVRGSCPQERSLVWWRRRSCVGFTTTPWLRTSNEQLRVVSSGSGKMYCSASQWLSRCFLKSPEKDLSKFVHLNIFHII